MRVQSITLWQVTLPMKFDFHTAKGMVRERHTLVVDVLTDGGRHGYGEVVAFDTPFYTAETIKTSEEWLNQVIPYFVGVEMKEPWDCYKVFEALTSTFLTPPTPKTPLISPTLQTPPISPTLQTPLISPTLLTSPHSAPMAWAGLENALLHAYFEENQQPMIESLLKQEGLLGEGESADINLNSEIPVGYVFGDMPTPDLLARIENAVQAGCKRVKIKLTPRDAVQRLSAVRETFPDLILAGDANRSFDVKDWAQVAALDQFNLRTIEEPFALIDDDVVKTYEALPADFWETWHTPITFDESIQSLELLQAMEAQRLRIEKLQSVRVRRAKTAIEKLHTKNFVTSTIEARTIETRTIETRTIETELSYKPQPVLNIKIGRLGGLREVLRCIAYCRTHGWGFWIGSMVESGISKILHVSLAALPDVWMAGDLSDSKRYFEEDLISPDISFKDGSMKVPRGIGLGVAVQREKLQEYGRILKEYV